MAPRPGPLQAPVAEAGLVERDTNGNARAVELTDLGRRAADALGIG